MMKVQFATLPPGRVHPLSFEDLRILSELVPPDVVKRIGAIVFQDNQTTTQEASLCYRKSRLRITVNFCLERGLSRLLSTDKRYLSFVTRLGGRPLLESRKVAWDEWSAKLYALFLLTHELAHVVYIESHANVSERRGSAAEERWCDEYALTAVGRLKESDLQKI